MNVEDMILISVDDHVVEPPTVFDNHLPSKWKGQAPVLVSTETAQYWEFEGNKIPNIGLNAVIGRPPEEYGIEPTRFAEMREGCYDIKERIRDMNAGGILGSMCFPSFPQFCGQLFARASDRDLGLALVQAYNDWHIDEWCGEEPGRFIPLSVPAIWDPEIMAAEVRRVADKGCHAVTFSENPYALGWPSMHSDTWDPFWKACVDVGTVPCLHIGSSSTQVVPSPDSPFDVLINLTPINIVQAAGELLWSPVLRKFPGLKIALSEGGIGWIPYFLERADYTYIKHHKWTGQDFGDKLPSDYFREHIITCFIDDPVGVKNRHAIGVENVTWECDYPHSDCTWPNPGEALLSQCDGVPDNEIDMMSWQNAARLFHFDPFKHRAKEDCTVGALRALATDVDTSPRSYGRKLSHGIVRARDLALTQAGTD